MNGIHYALLTLLVLAVGISGFSEEVFAQVTVSYNATNGAGIGDSPDDGNCDGAILVTNSTTYIIRQNGFFDSGDCRLSDMQFELPSLPIATSVTNVTLTLNVTSFTGVMDFDFTSIDFDDLSTRTADERFVSVQGGSEYADNLTVNSTGLHTFNLTGAVGTDILTVLDGGGGEFSIGINHNNFLKTGALDDVVFDSQTGSFIPSLEFTYLTPDPPGAIDDLTLDATGAETIDLSWTEPELDGVPLINYLINSTTPYGDPLTFVANTTNTYYNVTGLSVSTDYSFRVSALTEAGYNVTDGVSTILNVTTHNTQPPTGLTVDTPTLTTLLLSWIAPASGDTVTGYQIERESPTGGGFSTIVADTGNTDVTYTDTGLASGFQYNYRVSSISSLGTSVPSTAAANYTTGAPFAPTALNVTDTSTTSLTLDWIASVANGYAVTGYQIERESPVGGGFSVVTSDTGNTTTSYTDTGLVGLTQYNYRVSGISSQGTGEASSTAFNYTLPGAPLNLVVNPEGTSTTDLNLEWDAPAVTTGINGYVIERAPSVGGTFSVISANTTNTNTYYNDTGLTTNTFYNYRVSTLGNQSTSAGDTSNTYSQTTYHLPDAVTTLTATEAGFGSTLLQWTTPSTLYGYLLGYQINYTTPVGDPTTIYTSSTGDGSVTAIIGLPINEYSFRVSAVTIHGTNITGSPIANITTTQDITLGDLDIDFSEQPEGESIPITYTLTPVDDDTDNLQVFYDSSYDLNCDFAYKFAGTNQTYTGLTENLISGTSVYTNFTLNGANGELIDVRCWNADDPTIAENYQVNEGTIPLFEQVNNFNGGIYGTEGQFGIFDLVTLLAVIVSMIGFNRYNPAVGAVLLIMILGVLAYYEMIELSSLILGVLALGVMLAITTVRKQ